MEPTDVAYFSRRLREERQRAASSAQAETAAIHRQLAAHYEQALAAGDSSAAAHGA